MRLMASLLAQGRGGGGGGASGDGGGGGGGGGAGTQPCYHFLCRHGAACARAGAVAPTVAALSAFPPNLARAATARMLDELRRGAAAGSEVDGVALMGAIAEAAEHSGATLRRALAAGGDAGSGGASRGGAGRAAGTDAVATAAADGYDYMLEEEERARQHAHASGALLARLRADPSCGALLPLVLACAADARCGGAVRAAAVRALGRFAHLHPAIAAEDVLPAAVSLARATHVQAPVPVEG